MECIRIRIRIRIRTQARGCAALTDLYKLLCMDHLIGHYSGILSGYTQGGSSSDKKEAELWLHLGYISKNPYVLTNTESPELLRSTQ